MTLVPDAFLRAFPDTGPHIECEACGDPIKQDEPRLTGYATVSDGLTRRTKAVALHERCAVWGHGPRRFR